MKKVILIFSGYNNRAVLAFCRVLANNDAPFAIIANNTNDPIFLTAYAAYVVCIRQKKQLEITDISVCVEKCATKFPDVQEFVLAPSTEALNRFFLAHRKKLEQYFKICLPLANQELYM